MLKRTLFIFIVALAALNTKAQYESNVHQGEFGAAIGLAHYYGDLNTSAAMKPLMEKLKLNHPEVLKKTKT